MLINRKRKIVKIHMKEGEGQIRKGEGKLREEENEKKEEKR